MEGWNSSFANDTGSTFTDSITPTSWRNVSQTAWAATFLFVIILLAMVGNIMVIVAIRRFSKLRDDRSNLFIINLGVTDLCNGVLVMMSSFISLVCDWWPFGQFLCDLACAANYCFIIVSMLTLCFISIERYQAVVHPLHYPQKMTHRRIFSMIAYSWGQGIVFAFIPVIFRWIRYDYWEVVCAISWHTDPRALYYVITAFLLCFLFPGIVLAVCYTHILKEARNCKVVSCQPRLSDDSVGEQQRRKMKTNNSKMIRSLILVVLAYFIFMTPFCVTKLLKVIFPVEGFLPGYVNLVASWFAFMSSAINPLIYGIFRKDFRDVFIKIFRLLPFFSTSTTPKDISVSGTQSV